MSTKVVKTAADLRVPPRTPEEWRSSELLKQYGCGPIAFFGSENALYERHLVFDRVIDPQGRDGARAFRGRSRIRFETSSHNAGC
jgi:starch phosphorylase